ncbi:MAG: hypothetical protein KDA32_01395 [Phycisphaerales bacterium]|nr:hypothetical protein [Phycisphaerales bacterium]
MPRDILQQLQDADLLAIRISGGEWPRGLLSSTLIPDAWMGLVETRDGRRKFVPAGEDPQPDRDATLLLARSRRLTLPLSASDLLSADNDEFTIDGELLVNWEADAVQLAALLRRMPASGELTQQALYDAMMTNGAAETLRRFCQEASSAALSQDDIRVSLEAALRGGLASFLFEYGLSFDRLARVTLVSRSFSRRQIERRAGERELERIAAREMLQQAALSAAQKRLDLVGGLLERLRGAAGSDAQGWRGLLPTLTPTERGQLLENLWRVTPNRRVAQAILIVAGGELHWIDPNQPTRITRTFAAPEDLGPLRSVRYCAERAWILLGAACRVWIIGAESGAVVHRFEAACEETPRTGFNDALIAGDWIYATHSQLGCVRWSLTRDAHEALLTPAHGAPRSVRALALSEDGRVLFAADDCVMTVEPDASEAQTLTCADSVVFCLAIDGQTLYAGTADGALRKAELAYPETWTSIARIHGAMEAIALRRWSDLIELITPANVSGAQAVYPQENVVTRLFDTPTTVRRVWASDDCVVALSERRDRLYVATAGGAPDLACEAPLSRLLGRSIQDVCLVTATREVETG